MLTFRADCLTPTCSLSLKLAYLRKQYMLRMRGALASCAISDDAVMHEHSELIRATKLRWKRKEGRSRNSREGTRMEVRKR